MSRKFRVRVGSAKCKNVISKGGSSSSNPKSNRHRMAAKTAALLKRIPFEPIDDKLEGGGSASDDLARHLSLHSMNLGKKAASTSKKSAVGGGGASAISAASMVSSFFAHDDDAASEGGGSENGDAEPDALTTFSRNSARTELTHFTNCTNPTFDPVHREWKSGSKLHSDVVAVLAAVAEIIHQNNGSESDVEYYGALLTCLEGTSAEDLQKVAATAYLLHLTAKKVPKSVIISYFSHSSKIIYEKLTAVEVRPESTTAVKFLLSSLGIILVAQPTSIWQYDVNRNLLVSILKFSNNDQPWVRNMSRRVLRNLLVDSVRCAENGAHPVAKFVGEVILKGLQAPLETKYHKASVARLLCLLEGIFHKMPKSIFRQLAEHILHLGTVNDKMLKCAAFQCLQKALFQQPNDFCLGTDTNTQLIVALRAIPSPADISVCAYWLRALVEAHVCLAAREELKSVDLLDETLQICAKLFRRKSKELSEAVHLSSTRLIQCCIQQNSRAAIAFLGHLHGVLDGELAEESWKWVLKTMASLYQETQSAIVSDGGTFATVMKSLAEFRDREKECFCAKEIEELFGTAIRHVGMVEVLTVAPLNITGDGALLAIDFKRTWLLPVLVKSVQSASLQFFAQYFVPLAMKIHSRMRDLPDLQAKLYAVIESQIWSILPKIVSTNPKDFLEAFPTLCPIIGAALNERPDLRLTLLATLRAALCHPTPAGENPMQRFARNFLPMLFSIYTASGTAPMLSASGGASLNAGGQGTVKNGGLPNMASDQSVKLATLETIKLYVEMIPKELLIVYINMAVTKIQDAGNSLQSKALILDILTAMSRVADTQCLTATVDATKSWFSDRDIHMQKKAYRLLAEIYQRFGAKSPSLNGFFAENLQFVKKLIEKGVSKVAACAWPWRVVVFRNIVNAIDDFDDLRAFCALICGEIILFLDRMNSKQTRTQSAKCLQEMCARLVSVGCESDSEAASSVLDPILEKTFVHISENVHEDAGQLKALRTSLIALAIICQRHVAQINASALSRAVAYATHAVGVRNWETRPLALRVVRVLCARMPAYCIQQYKELILSSIFTTQTSKTSTVRVRKANVLLFEVLIDKFGAETVTRHASRSAVWVKQLKNMEKIRRRRLAKAAAVPQADAPPSSAAADQRRKSKRKDSDDDDDSGDEMEFVARSSAKAASTIATMAARGAQKRTAKVELSDSSDDEEEVDDEDVEMDEE